MLPSAEKGPIGRWARAERVGAQGSPTQRACKKAHRAAGYWHCLAGRGRPVDGGAEGQTLGRAWDHGDEACQMREEQVSLIWAPVA